MSEFHQCVQTLLKLYKLHHKPLNHPRVIDFTAYSILCIVDSKQSSPILTFLAIRDLPPALLSNPKVHFVLSVKRAYDSGDFMAYFRLFLSATGYFKAIMKPSLDKVRVRALFTLCTTSDSSFTDPQHQTHLPPLCLYDRHMLRVE